MQAGKRSTADPRFYGVYPAQVVDNADPDEQGRVKIRHTWMQAGEEQTYEAWARLATLMAGDNRGSWFIPDVDDEVLVAFEAGDPRRPYVVGALWNGQDALPETLDANNSRKTLRSRSGLRITLDDTPGQETLTLVTPGGQTVVLKDGPGEIEITDSNGSRVTMEPLGVTVTAAVKVTIQASEVEVSAGVVTVNAPMARCSGVVQVDTLIANSVVSASYSPGAGNIW